MGGGNKKFQDEWKIVVLGAGGVGKSALTIRYIMAHFVDEYDPTIEDRKQVEINDQPHLLDILDTAGEEEFSAMRDVWIRVGRLFVIVYAINSMSSFDEVSTRLQQIRRIKEDSPYQIMLVGNKDDLKEERTVPREQAEEFAESEGLPYVETSAKIGNGVEEVFYDLVTYAINDEYSQPNRIRNVKRAQA